MYTGKKLVFNGFDFSAVLAVEDVRRPLLPTIANNFRLVPGRRGALHKTNLGTMIIEVDIRMITDSEVGLLGFMREMAGKLFVTEPAKLITDETGRWDMALLDGDTEVERFFEIGGATLKFSCPSGCSYGPGKNETLVGTNNIVVDGTLPTRGKATITMTANASSVMLRNITTNQLVSIATPLVTGNIIVIDFEKELVTLNGNLIMNKVSFTSDFFDLVPGPNQLNLSTGASAVITYDTRWL